MEAELDTSLSFSGIVDAIGITRLARHFGHRNVSTVASWKQRNSIPPEHWDEVIKAAEEAGRTDIQIRTFVEAAKRRVAA